MFRFVCSLVTLGVMLQVSATPFAQDAEESVDELMEAAGAQIQQQDYKAAAATLQKVVELDAENPIAWQLLGFSLHLSGDVDGAIPAHERAATFDQTRGISLYNLGCAYTLKSDTDKAFDYLNQAVAAGFRRRSQFETDGDLDALREDVRFERLMARVRQEDVTDDFTADALVGQWLVESETVAGARSSEPADLITVTPDAFTVTAAGQDEDAVPYEVDTTTMTPTIEFAETKGILKLNDDRLTLCYELGNADAPESFSSTANNGKTLAILRRVLSPQRLAGTWAYTYGIRAGAEVAEERLAGEVTVTAERFKLPASKTEFFVMSYSLSAVDDLTAIDLSIESGPVPEGTALGIIKLEDDVMTLCYDPMGQKRPSAFESTASNGFFLFTLKREASAE